MKTISMFLIALAILSTSELINAQESETSNKPGWFVFSQNKVSSENRQMLNALLDSLLAPILNELVNERKLIGWGHLIHAWGDE